MSVHVPPIHLPLVVLVLTVSEPLQITVNGELLYSKLTAGKFPDNDDIVAKIGFVLVSTPTHIHTGL
jgi:hypothetical protein